MNSEHALKVLLVEDEPSILSTLRDLLSIAGHQVVATVRAEDAQDALRAEPFDLLLTDIELRGMSGLELLRHARLNAPWMDVVLMTANAPLEDMISALKQGASDLLLKPFDLGDLLVRIAHITERRQLRRGPADAGAGLVAQECLVSDHADRQQARPQAAAASGSALYA